MVPFEDGPGEIVEVGATALAMVPLASRLGLIMSVSNNLGAAATWAACTVWPSDVTDGVKAFGIIDQVVDPNKESIALAFSNHGLSSRVGGAQDNYAKTIKKSRTICSADNFSANPESIMSLDYLGDRNTLYVERNG